MQVSKWGNSLAVRLPAELVRELNLKEGDDIQLYPAVEGFAVARTYSANELLASLRKYRGRLTSDKRMSRDEVNAR